MEITRSEPGLCVLDINVPFVKPGLISIVAHSMTGHTEGAVGRVSNYEACGLLVVDPAKRAYRKIMARPEIMNTDQGSPSSQGPLDQRCADTTQACASAWMGAGR